MLEVITRFISFREVYEIIKMYILRSESMCWRFYMTKQKLIVIGNGMAGMRCVEEILIHSPDCFDITVFGSEPHVNYNRILLSTVLQGSTKLEDINIHSFAWYNENNITLFKGESVTHIDTKRKIIKQIKTERRCTTSLLLLPVRARICSPLKGLKRRGPRFSYHRRLSEND